MQKDVAIITLFKKPRYFFTNYNVLINHGSDVPE